MPVTFDPLLALKEGSSWADSYRGATPEVVTYSFTVTDAALFGLTPLHEEARAAVRAAFAAWDAVCGLAFVEINDPYPAAAPMIDISFRNLGAAGLGLGGYPGVGTPIYFNVSTIPASWAAGSVMFGVAVHEIGHTLGLKHPFEGTYTLASNLDNTTQTVMSYNTVGANPTGPAPLDIAVVQSLYGSQASEATDGIDWSFNAPSQRFTFSGGAAADRIIGTSAGDDMHGFNGNDSMYSGHGIDQLFGGEGNDLLCGEEGSDIISGGAGNDLLYGEAVDRFYSSTRYGYDDVIQGGEGNDVLYGENGDDLLDGGVGRDALNGGDGFDIALVSATKSNLTVTSLGAGQYSVLDPTGPYAEIFTGIEAIQAIDGIVLLGSDSSGLFSRFDLATGQNSFERGDVYSGPVGYLKKQLFGSSSSEIFGGTSRSDFVNAFAGDDAIDAGLGDDVLDGGTGSNFLTGGQGRDTFFLDGRGGTVTWGTITDWQPGEQLSIWGYRPGISQTVWVENDGAEGFRGISLHADLDGNGVIDTSATWANLTYAALPAPFEFDGLLWFK